MNRPDWTVIRELINSSYTKRGRLVAVKWLRWRDKHVSEHGEVYTLHPDIKYDEDDVYNNRIIRVEIGEEFTTVVTLGLDIKGEVLDMDLEGDYASPQELPEWVQKKIAVLMLTSCEPPTEEVKGVGRRMAENIFWVHVE